MKKVILIAVIIIFLLGGCDYFSSPASWDNEAFQITPTGQPGSGEPVKDCTYDVETDKRVGVTIRTDEGYLRSLYEDRGNKDFVLVKRDAGISCVKMWNNPENGTDRLGGEMIKIGTTRTLPGFISPDPPRDVYLARGHCYGGPNAGSNCLDPLTLDIVFVLLAPGSDKDTCQQNGGDSNKSAPGYWWTFDVYINKEAFARPSEPTEDGLPAWIRNCQGWLDGRGGTLGVSTEGKVLAGQTFNFPPIIAPYTDITPEPVRRSDLKDYYLVGQELTSLPADWGELLGKYQNTEVNVWISADGYGTLVLGTGQAGDKYYKYITMDQYTAGTGRTLQLGSFFPIRPPRGTAQYEWWTPSCKPALYFYPEKPTELSVIVKPQGKITQSIPDHKDGWQVVAYPDGTVRELNGTKYPYLYYEAEIEKVKVPQEKFLVEGKDLPEFFGQALPLLGLNQKEATDFLKYWLPKLQGDKKWLIGLLPKEEIDRVEKIEFSSNPDSFLRVRFYFRPYEAVNETIVSGKIIYSKGMNLEYFLNNLGIWSFRQKPQRSGFTVVDWGGILAGGDCGISEIAQ